MRDGKCAIPVLLPTMSLVVVELIEVTDISLCNTFNDSILKLEKKFVCKHVSFSPSNSNMAASQVQ